MDQLGAMRVFVAVVEAKGFSSASRTLGMPLATVCRKVTELENHLGARLLARSTRKVTVTESGHRYYEDVQQILRDIGDAERLASGEYQRVTGLLAITAPSLFGRLHVLPIVNDFMRLHGEIETRLLLTNFVLDLPEERVDLGVRIGALSDGSAPITRVGAVRQVVCASPAYLRAEGRPVSPDQLAKHQCIGFSRSSSQVPWAFRMPSGKLQNAFVRPRLLLNSTQGAVDSALQDVGLVQLYSYQAAPYVASGDLEIVLEDFEVEPPPVALICPHRQPVPQKVKAFIEFAIPALEARLLEIARMCEV